MYNSDTPLRAELPSSKQLLRSTVLAAIAAMVLLVCVVLPAEYGIDPTGAGRVLGLTQMEDIKQQLAEDAAADAAATSVPSTKSPPASQDGSAATATATQIAAAEPAVSTLVWRDEMSATLTPGEGTEIKLRMLQGAKAQFSWLVEGGKVNFDTHGDAPGQSISYEKGRGVAADEGVLEAEFTGNHGWYWRNRGKSDVTVILRTRGDYTDIKRMK